MNTTARFQVVEVKYGYAVKDTRDETVWTKTYTTLNGAINKAVALNESTKNHTYLARQYAK